MDVTLASLDIGEVTSPGSAHLPGMNEWLAQIFAEYCPPRFGRPLAKRRHPDGQHEARIFVGLVDHVVAGLVQLLFREWQGDLLTDIDLLAVDATPLFWHGEPRAIDFDDSGFGYWVFDLAVALDACWEDPEFRHFRDALLHGYTEVRSLPAE